MKPLIAFLSLALAALALPSSSAELGAPCHVNQSNDTVCHVEAAGCEADAYMYDVEDALNHYSASCLCVFYDNYGRPALRQTCFATAAAASDPVRTHCWAMEDASGCSTTADAGAAECTYATVTGTGGLQAASLGCATALAACDADVAAGSLPSASCDPVLASAAAAEPDLQPCTAGFAQTWCDFTVGPCDVRVTPWTAWGDVYAWADCDGPNMTRCYAEAHTQDPLGPEQWCAF